MPARNTFRKGDKSFETFERQLALYRAKVYERYMPLNELGVDKSVANLGEFSTNESSPILVIEDNADDWFLMQWALRQTFPTTETVWLADAAQVSTYLENCLSSWQALPKVILLDLYLPSISKGLRILQSLKAHQRLREIPVIAVSRSADVRDMANAFKYASSMYLIKPPTYGEWVKRMGEIRKLVHH